ncbi:unnamed protein product [Allacma fusca]|uniref:Uncharacterized protein n=1 Tax=Allacma fusca TaxID=39272 RepID=A0A8J2NZ70_9HEXA|nr:unnamed protein product [Allacma fusca]
MGPYKQEFSRQSACAGSSGQDDGPGGNPPPGGKEKFYLPRVLLYRDSYCSVCGHTVKEEWKFCRNPKCQNSTVPQYPEVPPGWNRCPRCSLSYLHPGQHFCCICRLRTQAGMIWQTQASLLNRRIREMEDLFRRGQWHPEGTSVSSIPAGHSGTVSVVGTSTFTSGSNAAKHPQEGFIDDEGDKLMEKMLLDEEEEQDEDIDVKDGEEENEKK